MLKNTSDHREEGENRQMKNFVNVDTRFQKSINLTLDTGCFPNKKILRNSPCLPACKQKNIATRLRDTT